MLYVLIVASHLSSSYFNTEIISMQEFDSKKTCEIAKTFVMQSNHKLKIRAECLPK